MVGCGHKPPGLDMAWVDWGQGDLPDSSVAVDNEPAVADEDRDG